MIENPISSYFKKVAKKDPGISDAGTSKVSDDEIQNENNKTEETQVVKDMQKPSTIIEPDGTGSIFSNDVGLFVNKHVDDFTKCKLLENPWVPPKSYKLPHSLHTKGGKELKRYLGHHHLEQRSWLAYSHEKQGLFCKFCMLFAGERCGHNKGMIAQNLVTQPLTTYAKLLGKQGHLQSHEDTSYHKACVQAGIDFLKSYHNPQKSVVNQVDSQRLQQVKENRDRLRPIVESIIFLGRQNIPLRGHRDDGCLDETAGPSNEGNFRELLRFKVASGDENLKRHLSTASSRATYISNTSQNDLITCCGDIITETILNQVKNAKYYSVIFDETTDISHTEQLSLNLRYLHKNEIREDFVKFVDAFDNISAISPDQDPNSEQRLTGEALGKIVLKLLQELSLDLNNCVGIGTDSCSVMSSEAIGAVTEMQKVMKSACRCPCLNHVLNNSISTSVRVACIRNAVGVMKTVVSFFNMSAKRNQVLKATLGYQLSSLCETRWVERHESVIKFRAGLTNIVDALTSITTWTDSKSSTTASTLLNSLCTPEFLISMLVLIDILKMTLPLSRLLQTPSLDSNKASQAVTNTLTTIQAKRTQAATNFNKVFVEFTELAKELDVEVRLPRLASKQTKRANHDGTPEEYYRRSIYIPLLDNVSSDLSTRLSQSSLECFGLRGIIPTILVGAQGEQEVNLVNQLKRGFDKFSPIIGSGDRMMNAILFEGELELWTAHWKSEKERNAKMPEEVMSVLDACDSNTFPQIASLLRILATLPGNYFF